MNLTMSTSTPKQQVESLLNKLPENCSLEDIQYHLYILDKVRHGREDAKQARDAIAGRRGEAAQPVVLTSKLIKTN
jgi:hypothetical protein